MTTVVSQSKTTLLFLSLACNLQFSSQRTVVIKGGENSIQPSLGHVRLVRLASVMNVNKRGLATYKTSSQEREEHLAAKLTELVRLEEKLYKLWKEFGEIEINLGFPSMSLKIYYFTPDRMLFCAKHTMCAIRFTREFQIGGVSVLFFSSKVLCYCFKASVDATLVQSLTITMARIREVTTKMASVSKEIGVQVIRQRRVRLF